jgi:hypothetical protein
VRNQEESFSALKEYFGIEKRTLLIFTALVVGVLVVVTVIYVAIFGFREWKTNMKHAGSMIMAKFDKPATGLPQNATCPGANRPSAPCYVPAVAPAPGPYTCPQCGTAGHPRWSTSGAPICPNCRAVMSVAGQTV